MTAQDFDPGKILQSIDNEEIVIMIDGKRKRMLKAEVDFQQLFSKAIKGDLNSAKLIAKMAEKYFGPEAEGPSDTRFIVMRDEFFDKSKTEQGTPDRNPPKDTSFQKARMANPKALATRNKPPVSVGYLFRKIARDQVAIDVAGKRTTMFALGPLSQAGLHTVVDGERRRCSAAPSAPNAISRGGPTW